VPSKETNQYRRRDQIQPTWSALWPLPIPETASIGLTVLEAPRDEARGLFFSFRFAAALLPSNPSAISSQFRPRSKSCCASMRSTIPMKRAEFRGRALPARRGPGPKPRLE